MGIKDEPRSGVGCSCGLPLRLGVERVDVFPPQLHDGAVCLY